MCSGVSLPKLFIHDLPNVLGDDAGILCDRDDLSFFQFIHEIGDDFDGACTVLMHAGVFDQPAGIEIGQSGFDYVSRCT